MMLERKTSQSGFTLIEVMIAIALMAVISLISWRALDSVTRASSHLDDSTEQTTAIMRVVQQFELDVSLLATELPSETPQVIGPDGLPIRLRLLPDALTTMRQGQIPFRIEIVRTAPDAPGEWQRVYWWRERNTLYRSAAASSDRFPLPAPDASAAVAVLQDVSDFDVRAWQPGSGWIHLPVTTQSLPAIGLEMIIAQHTARGDARYRRVVPLR